MQKICENAWGTLLEALAVWYSWKVGFFKKICLNAANL